MKRMKAVRRKDLGGRAAAVGAALKLVPVLVVALIPALIVAACGGSSSSPSEPRVEGAVFRVRACGEESFRILVNDPAVIAEAERLVAAGEPKIVVGRVEAGDGGFNAPWSWHLAPATVGFAEVTIELCDGCPSFLEAHPADWLGRDFCPWSAQVVARER